MNSKCPAIAPRGRHPIAPESHLSSIHVIYLNYRPDGTHLAHEGLSNMDQNFLDYNTPKDKKCNLDARDSPEGI
jgi:hypothetical protein